MVVGAGYVGLATAVHIAGKGIKVTVVEKRKDVVESLNKGRLHFRDATLSKHLKEVRRRKLLSVTTPAASVYQTGDFVFIAIDSVRQGRWRMKAKPFVQIAEWLGEVERPVAPTIVMKSTNVVGFASQFRQLLDATAYGKRIGLAVSPEFLREGLAFEDSSNPWRVVIGTDDKRTAERVARLYRRLYRPGTPIILTDWASAEAAKLGANVYLAHRLSFINEMADYTRQAGLDLEAIRRIMALDPRIGNTYFDPGLGFGGSCLPKDCHLISSSESGFSFKTAATALAINEAMLDRLIFRLRDRLGNLKGSKIALLGAAFKPETDDTRGSRSLQLARKLHRRKVGLSIYDPYLDSLPGRMADGIQLAASSDAALKGASALIIGTAHRRFRKLQPERVCRLMKGTVVCDPFRILPRKRWQTAGLEFI